MPRQMYKHAFSGNDAAAWFMNNMHGVHSVDIAASVGQRFMDLGLIASVKVPGPPPPFRPTRRRDRTFLHPPPVPSTSLPIWTRGRRRARR